MAGFCSIMDGVHSSSRPVWHFAKSLTTRSIR
jgi:hypothetical protein